MKLNALLLYNPLSPDDRMEKCNKTYTLCVAIFFVVFSSIITRKCVSLNENRILSITRNRIIGYVLVTHSEGMCMKMWCIMGEIQSWYLLAFYVQNCVNFSEQRNLSEIGYPLHRIYCKNQDSTQK